MEIENLQHLEKEFESSSDRPIILCVYHAFCIACMNGVPGFLEMARSMPTAKYLKAEVDDVDGIAEKFLISHVPTYIAIWNSEERDRYLGAEKLGLRQFIENNI